MSDSLNVYRQEIIEAEKIRAELMKWKMIMVGVIGSVGLGLSGESAPPGPVSGIILGVIPFTCLYIDTFCYRQSLHVLAIERFIISGASASYKNDEILHVEYEKFCRSKHENIFPIFDDVMLILSTVFISILLLILVSLKCEGVPILSSSCSLHTLTLTSKFTCFAALIGVMGAIFIRVLYSKNARSFGCEVRARKH